MRGQPEMGASVLAVLGRGLSRLAKAEKVSWLPAGNQPPRIGQRLSALENDRASGPSPASMHASACRKSQAQPRFTPKKLAGAMVTQDEPASLAAARADSP